MTRDEIIATAKRAGFTRMQCNSIYNQERLARLIFNVAAVEREACAKVCDALASQWTERTTPYHSYVMAFERAADDIRRRGKT